MDANQRSESNNQTNNGANEKWTPGSKGNTTSGPMDHTHPQGAVQQQGQQGAGRMGTQQSGAGPGASGEHAFGRDDGATRGGDLPGGSMQSQQTGGSGPQQGITDSHQRQMEIHSEAWGLLEQPVGRRPKDSGTDVGPHGLAAQSMQHGRMAGQAQQLSWPQEAQSQARPEEQSAQQAQSRQAGQSEQYADAQFGQSEPSEHPQQSVDRAGSQTGPGARESGTEDVHVSNDVSGGLPRSPGNSGPRRDNAGWQPGGSMQRDPAVHQSNDLAGGLPRSPAGANRLAGDRKMDDDTGFSRK